MKKIILVSSILAIFFASCTQSSIKYGESVSISEKEMLNKIKGGWFGQTIGCTYGGPTEFKYRGGPIWEGVPIIWYDDYIYDTFISEPGLYDDVYMDLTFVDVMTKYGVDAPVERFAESFANADYKLWHANQAARYNILNGIPAPLSGHWKNNPHADDIDFQIESDFIGMMTPGLPNVSNEMCDKIGHIMNYGDGWYGGVFISAMYSLAYVCNDIPAIVSEALKTIPEGTKFHSAISDVIKYWKKFPNDWKRCWFEVEQRHGLDIGCPEGVWNGYNIDAVINASYVVIGLLYGKGDFGRTIDIATRCGHDSDCNPASAAGILGVMNGYDAIPEKWTKGCEKIKDTPFPYTQFSLNSICQKNLDLLKEIVVANGGTIENGIIKFTANKPSPVRYERSFEGIVPIKKAAVNKVFNDELNLVFEGNSVVVEGRVIQTGSSNENYVAEITAFIDGVKVEDFKMPLDYIKRKYEIFSKYCIESGRHELKLVVNNPHKDFALRAVNMIVYDKE